MFDRYMSSITSFAAILHNPVLRWALTVLMVPSSFLVAYPVDDLWRQWKKHVVKRRRLNRLKTLNPAEKRVLGQYLKEGRTTQPWSPANQTVDALAASRILYRVASTLGPYVYAIDDDVWEYLLGHPELVPVDPDPVAVQHRPKPRRLKKGARRKAHALNSKRFAAARNATEN
jgi:hypothetical protein